MPKFKNKQNEVIVLNKGKKDERTIWLSRSVAIVAHVWFLVDGIYYVLLGKRGPHGDKPGLINIPCGYLDYNENLKQAMFREVWEETALDLSKYDSKKMLDYTKQPWHVYSEPDENRQNVAMHMAIIIADDKLPKVSIKNCEVGESLEAFWKPYSEALSIPEKDWAFNHDKKMSHFYRKMFHDFNY